MRCFVFALAPPLNVFAPTVAERRSQNRNPVCFARSLTVCRRLHNRASAAIAARRFGGTIEFRHMARGQSRQAPAGCYIAAYKFDIRDDGSRLHLGRPLAAVHDSPHAGIDAIFDAYLAAGARAVLRKVAVETEQGQPEFLRPGFEMAIGAGKIVSCIPVRRIGHVRPDIGIVAVIKSRPLRISRPLASRGNAPTSGTVQFPTPCSSAVAPIANNPSIAPPPRRSAPIERRRRGRDAPAWPPNEVGTFDMMAFPLH